MNQMYNPLTIQEVSSALALHDYGDDYDPTGETIAKDMLDGVVTFTRDELLRLAAFKGIALDELLRYEQFKRYQGFDD